MFGQSAGRALPDVSGAGRRAGTGGGARAALRPRLHAVATHLKAFQALSYEQLQAVLSNLFGLTLSQFGLMNLLRRAQTRFRSVREEAFLTLRRAAAVASDETGVRIEGGTSRSSPIAIARSM